jgi:L-ascorbate metabolism protein UlaG (beta-lactamase superfamily)
MKFKNLEPFKAGLPQVLRMMLTRRVSPWPLWVDYPLGSKPPRRVEGASLRLTYINHATVLIQTGGLNILSDPHYSLRCSPLSFAGPKRVHAPGIAFEDLPPIDVVLLSHNHYDHLDLPTLNKLVEGHPCKIVTGLKATRDLPKSMHSRVLELNWWQSVDLGMKIHFVPVQHFSARSFHDRFKVLWGGFCLESPAGRIYFPGDTAYGRHFSMAKERLGPMRVAVMPVGAYEPRWFMKEVHMIPEEAVQAYLDLGCSEALAVHWGCFQLTEEPIDEPLIRLKAALQKAGIEEGRFRALDPGQHWELS